VLVLAAALVLRALIAWVWWPQSGFFLDLDLFVGWARVLNTNGWGQFYRPDPGYFIAYPPAYLPVVSAIGWIDQAWVAATGGGQILLGLLKLPPMLADIGTAGLLAAITSRILGPRAMVPAAALFAFNPAVIFDSAVYGQNDSVGTLLVVASIYALIRDRTELAAALAVLAALLKFQFGFLIPIVLVVGLRRHLGTGGSPVRVLTSLAAAVGTLLIVILPFGVALHDAARPARSLWHLFTAASETFPGVTQNAFNLWMNPAFEILRANAAGVTEGRVVEDGALLLSIGPVGVTWQLLGGLLFFGAVVLALRLVGRRDDAVAIMIAAFIVATALYMFPTRIHERYLVPALGVGAPLVLLGRRGWPVVYGILSGVAFLAIYFVYTLPNLNRHLPRDPVLSATLLSPWGIYAVSTIGVGSMIWMLWQGYRMAATEASEGDRTRTAQGGASALRLLQGLSSRRLTLLMIVLVSLAAAVVSARVSFGADGWLSGLDLPKIHYPLASFYHEALAEGRLPLWSDRLGMGFPLYAEGNIGAFYPLNWLIFQLEPLAAIDLTRLIHLTLAGVGAGLLGLRASGSRPGALAAVVITVLGGAIVTKLEWWNLVAAYGWLPWVLLPIAGRSSPTPVAVATSGMLWGIQALIGHPNTWLLTGAAAAIFLLHRPLRTSLGHLGGFALIGGAVGAVQLVPTLLIQGISVRAAGLSANDLFTSATTPFDVIGLGFANAFVRAGADGAWDFASTWYPDGIFALLEAGAYVGLPSLGLAAIALTLRGARRWVVLGAVAIAIGVVAAFRPEWWQAIPILNGLRSPVRSYLLLTLAVAILAAIGTSRLGRDAGGGRRGVWAIGIVVGAYVATIVAARSFPVAFDWLYGISAPGIDAAGLRAEHERALAALVSLWPLALELAAGAVMAALLIARRSRETVIAAVAVVAVPLVLLSPLANPLRPASELSYADSPFVASVAAQSPERVLTINPPGYYDGMPDQLAAAGVADVDMFSSLNLMANDELVRQLRESDPDRLLRRAVGIDLVVTFGAPCDGTPVAEVPEQSAALCRVEDGLAAPYWLARDAVADGPARPGVPRADVDLARLVATARPVEDVEDSLTALRLIVDVDEDGWVYVDRAWWFGWITTVDGERASPRAALGGQLIAVPAGRHLVEMALVPWDALLGLGAGVVVLTTVGAWLWWTERRRASGEPVQRGGPHAPHVDDEADGEGDRGLEPDQAADAVGGEEEEERIEVLRVPVAELGTARIGVQEDRHEDGDDGRPAADDEPGR
jgi:hypothetical protein